MRHLHTSRVDAVESLPPLPRALFLLHNFYGVDVGTMAETLGEDREAIGACLADARAILHARICYSDPVPDLGPLTLALQERSQWDYRQSLETAFAESGYPGDVAWPIPPAGIAADQDAAAAFVVARLPTSLQKAVARSRRADVATVDLWRTVWLWRGCRRRSLLRVADALRCSGWEPFDEWLAEPVRACTSSSRFRTAVRRRVIRCIAIKSRCSFPRAALKELRARLAPALLGACVFRRYRAEQCTSEHVGIERIGARRNDKFAELANAAFLEGLRLGFERLQFRIDVAGFTHRKSPLSDGAAMIEEVRR